MPFQLNVRKKLQEASQVENHRLPAANTSPRLQLPIPSFEPVVTACNEVYMSESEEERSRAACGPHTKQPLGLLLEDLSDDSTVLSQLWTAHDGDGENDSDDDLLPIAFPKPIKQLEPLNSPQRPLTPKKCPIEDTAELAMAPMSSVKDAAVFNNNSPHVAAIMVPPTNTAHVPAAIHTNGPDMIIASTNGARRKRKAGVTSRSQEPESILDSTHAQLLQLAKVKTANTNTTLTLTHHGPPKLKSKDSNKLSGCLLCHFCPCRHLSKHDKKRWSKTPVIQDFTNLSPIAALEKHTLMDCTDNINKSIDRIDPNQDLCNSWKNIWDQYEQVELQLMARVRRLEQTISWFDHVAHKTAMELKKLRGKMAKMVREKDHHQLGLQQDLDHSSSDEDSDITEKHSTKQENIRKLKWNNKYLDYDDFNWEDTTNFHSKLTLDVAEQAKTKLFVFRKKLQPTLTQMFGTRETMEANAKYSESKEQQHHEKAPTTACLLWNAAKQASEVSEECTAWYINPVDEPKDGELIQDESETMDHLLELFDTETNKLNNHIDQ